MKPHDFSRPSATPITAHAAWSYTRGECMGVDDFMVLFCPHCERR